MVNYIKCNHVCPVCGTSFSADEWVSAYEKDKTLDGKALHVEYGRTILQCPHCHYAAESMTKPVCEAAKQYVLSDAFQTWRMGLDDSACSKLESGAKIAEAAGETYTAARCRLMMAWCYEDAGDSVSALAAREKYLQTIHADANIQLSPPQMVSYIDTLRQLRKFEDVIAAVRLFQGEFQTRFGADATIVKVLQAEAVLAKRGDAVGHFVSEVI